MKTRLHRGGFIYTKFYNNSFSLAIIPARGGSKRIPRKNIKPFAGKPIIAYSIAVAQESGCFSDIVVSTDDEEIADIARSFGGNVPFMRSLATANDYAGIPDVVKEVIIAYEAWAGRSVDLVCCILSTAPFVTAENILRGYQKISDGKADAVSTVVRYAYPIQRALRTEGDYISMICPENYPKRSQDLEPTYHDAAQFYWIKKDKLFEYGKIFIPRTSFICIDQMYSQDIDNEDDWRYAELKYDILHSKKHI